MKVRFEFILVPLVLAIVLLAVSNFYIKDEELKETVQFARAREPPKLQPIAHRVLQQASRKVKKKSWKKALNFSFPGKSNGPRERPTNVVKFAHVGQQKDPEGFKIRQPFSFPQPSFTRSFAEMIHSHWVWELQKYLKSIQGIELSLVTSSVEHTDILLNWLIAACVKIDPPLENVLVLSTDYRLYSTLKKRNISSLYVHKNLVVPASAKITSVFSQVHLIRMAVLRLINHYGYSVINYDCDAVLLKNPKPLFEGYRMYDLIGTFGKGPNGLYQKWGVALNTGVMLMRATPNMEIFWEALPHSDHLTTDDQNSINYCLQYLGIKWTNYNSSERIEDRSSDITGSATIQSYEGERKPEELAVLLLSFKKVCRFICDPNQRDSYYVWHPLAIRENRTVTRKKNEAKLGGAWHLRVNWRKLSKENSHLKGTDWLRVISYNKLPKLSESEHHLVPNYHNLSPNKQNLHVNHVSNRTYVT